MKIRLSVSEDRYQEIKTTLMEYGIEIDENAELVLSENEHFSSSLVVKDAETSERVFVPIEEIISIESFGHTVEVYTYDKSYQVLERLYKIQNQLDPDKFLRISNSVIIQTNKIKKIAPTLSMKFILTMSNGRNVDVTRSYYYIFKEYFDI